MIRAYFDRNVFQDLFDYRRGITVGDAERLRSAVRHGEIEVILSNAIIAETVARLASRPERVVAELRSVLELTGQLTCAHHARLVKDAGDLLNDDIRAYASGEPVRSPYYWTNISRLLKTQAVHSPPFHNFIRDDTRRKTTILDFLRERRKIKLQDARRSFREYWGENAVRFATIMADHAGARNDVERRGIKDLLSVRSVLLAAGITLSVIHSQEVENRALDGGDYYDFLHVTCAATADVFVTGDGGLAACLQRIPAVPVEIIDLPTLLSRLGRRYARLALSTGESGGAANVHLGDADAPGRRTEGPASSRRATVRTPEP